MLLSPSCKAKHAAVRCTEGIHRPCRATTRAGIPCSMTRDHMVPRLFMLPDELLEHIITHSSAESRLALLRTCRQLMNAVLSLQAAEWAKHLKTTLSMDYQANQSAVFPHMHMHKEGPFLWYSYKRAQSVLGIDHPTLQAVIGGHGILAAAPAPHVPCLTIVGFKQRSAQRGTTTGSVQRGPGQYAPQQATSSFFPVQSMLAFLCSSTIQARWLFQCIHSVQVLVMEHVVLKQPLPECIGRVCPALKSLELDDVIWPEEERAQIVPWPQLQQLTICKTECLNLARYFNPVTLPKLDSLHIDCKRSSLFSKQELVRSVVECSMGFSKQLSQLSLCGDSKAVQRMLVNCSAEPVFPKLTTLNLAVPTVQDAALFCLLTAAPHLTQLAVQSMQLSNTRKDLSDLTCNLRSLSIAHCFGSYVSTIAGLPNMPHLQHLQLPAFKVQSDQDTEAQVAAAEAAVKRLPDALTGMVQLSFMKASGNENELISKLQLVGPLLLALGSKLQTTLISNETITKPILRALGATGIPRITFRWCSWPSEDDLGQLCVLMPEMRQIEIKDYTLSMNKVQLLCRTTTIPITLHLGAELLQTCFGVISSVGSSLVTARRWDMLQV